MLLALYTPEDVAQALRVSPWWVRDQARRGLAPAVKVASAWRFTEAQYLALVQQHTVPAQPVQDTIPARRRRQLESEDTVSEAPVLVLHARPPRPRRKRATA